MSIGTTAVAIGTIAASAIGGVAANSAANTQADAANNASQLQYNLGEQQLGFNQQVFNTQQANEAPFLAAGQDAVGQLSTLMQPGGSLSQPWTGQFTAPTAAEAAQTPGYQFALQQGTAALDNSAAAAGGLGSGATGAALEQFGQGLASNTYQQTFNNSLTQYDQAYNQFLTNQNNQYNRLAGLAGTGQVATQQLGAAGSAASNTGASIAANTGAQVGQNINNEGIANASGYTGVANSINSGIGNLSSLALLNSTGALNNGSYNNASDNPYLINNPGTVIPGTTTPIS